MSSGTSREAFEAWWSSPAMTLVRAATTQYQSLTKSLALAAWQASRKQALDEATEVCIRVISSRDGERIPKNAAGAYECHDKIKELK